MNYLLFFRSYFFYVGVTVPIWEFAIMFYFVSFFTPAITNDEICEHSFFLSLAIFYSLLHRKRIRYFTRFILPWIVSRYFFTTLEISVYEIIVVNQMVEFLWYEILNEIWIFEVYNNSVGKLAKSYAYTHWVMDDN